MGPWNMSFHESSCAASKAVCYCSTGQKSHKSTWFLPVPFIDKFFTSRFFSPSQHRGVSKNSGTPKSSILIGFSIINHPFWGIPIFGNIHPRKTISTHVFFRMHLDLLQRKVFQVKRMIEATVCIQPNHCTASLSRPTWTPCADTPNGAV